MFATDVRTEQTKKRRGIRYEHIRRKKKREKNPYQSHELRKHILAFALTFVLVITCSMMFFTVKTKAQNRDEAVYYKYKYYKSITVSRGDSLWTYAAEYADEDQYDSYQNYIDEILQINGLSSESITAGQHLVVPYYSAEFVG